MTIASTCASKVNHCTEPSIVRENIALGHVAMDPPPLPAMRYPNLRHRPDVGSRQPACLSVVDAERDAAVEIISAGNRSVARVDLAQPNFCEIPGRSERAVGEPSRHASWERMPKQQGLSGNGNQIFECAQVEKEHHWLPRLMDPWFPDVSYAGSRRDMLSTPSMVTSQLCAIGYLAKIAPIRFRAFSAATCGVIPSRITSASAVPQICWASASA